MDLAKGQLVIACFLMFFDLSACFILRFKLIHFLRFPCQRFRHVDCLSRFPLRDSSACV